MNLFVNDLTVVLIYAVVSKPGHADRGRKPEKWSPPVDLGITVLAGIFDGVERPLDIGEGSLFVLCYTSG